MIRVAFVKCVRRESKIWAGYVNGFDKKVHVLSVSIYKLKLIDRRYLFSVADIFPNQAIMNQT